MDKQDQSLHMVGNAALTTHTDNVKKYKSVLQTTNYNFTGTKTSSKMCAGVLKPHVLYLKTMPNMLQISKCYFRRKNYNLPFLTLTQN